MRNPFHFAVFAFFLFTVFCPGAFSQDEGNWPRFRGPNGQGISLAKGLPVQWSEEENVLWKTEIPGEGLSSPIVWEDRIFLTSTTEEGKECRVIAVDRNTGKILWNNHVFDQQPKFKNERNSYATPSPTTDGKFVYAVFCGGAIVAVDFQGKTSWINKDVDFYSQHGLGTSPILYEDLLLLSVDHSNTEEPKRLGWQIPWDRSFLLALDKNTGKERWKGKRGMSRIAHVSPLIVRVEGKDQILSCAGDVIQGFDPENGELIWSIASQGEGVVPSPVFGGGLVYTCSGFEATTVRTVRPEGKGECTQTHIEWEQKRNAPTIASLLYVEPCVYTATGNGSFSCFDAKTGEFLWQKRLGGALDPSPLYAEGRIYVSSDNGTTTVLQIAEDPKQAAETVSKNELNERMQASIAVAGKNLILRTEKHLWCIGEK